MMLLPCNDAQCQLSSDALFWLLTMVHCLCEPQNTLKIKTNLSLVLLPGGRALLFTASTCFTFFSLIFFLFLPLYKFI